jgi:hypothetical protein|tara:strand:+ start:1985 stop:2482 length:498 start_codon:yes stop_codon:yes gene_type:complete
VIFIGQVKKKRKIYKTLNIFNSLAGLVLSNRFSKMKLLIFPMVFLMLVSSIFAYPIIISNEGVNHQEAKELVYSIPEVNFKYVKSVEFVNEPIKKFNWINNNTAIVNYYDGWYDISWSKNFECYNGKITIYHFDILEHELGHIFEHCELKRSISTEEFSNEFKLK